MNLPISSKSAAVWSDIVARAIVAVVIVGTTAVAVLRGQELPEPWWPALVATLSFLYNARGPANGNSQ